MRIAQDLSMSQVRKAGKSLTVRSAAKFTLGLIWQDAVGAPTGVTRANVATLFPWVADSGWPLPLSKSGGWQNGGKIDKAFRIATPMRKASWTKRFAEGWGGAAGCEWRWWQRWGGLEGMGRRCEREIAPKARSVREAAPSLAGRRGARVSESAFQVTCPSGSRHAETRILAKEPRPATTAVGTSRQGRVAIRRLVDSSIGRFRQLAQRLREA